jgi:hypothetical protein
MSGQFDVSLGYMEEIDAEAIARHRQMVEHWELMPSALANAKLHAVNELNRLVLACNKSFWGGLPADMRGPEREEMARLLQGLTPEAADELLKNCRLAAEQRRLVTLIEQAEARYLARQEEERRAQLQSEAEARLRAEFEAHDAAGKEARFEAWRISRG